jgi:hypothetical protein
MNWDISSWLTPSDETLGQLKTIGPMMSIFGSINSMVGSYYSAKSQQFQIESANVQRQFEATTRKNQLESNAINLDYEALQADLNARQSGLDAEFALYRGNREAGALSLKAGQIKSAQRTSMAARGLSLGVGSAKELQVSTDLMKEVDRNMILENAMRASWGERIAQTNYQNQALLKRTSAQNARTTLVSSQPVTSTVSPLGSAFGSLLSSAGTVASNWYTAYKED